MFFFKVKIEEWWIHRWCWVFVCVFLVIPFIILVVPIFSFLLSFHSLFVFVFFISGYDWNIINELVSTDARFPSISFCFTIPCLLSLVLILKVSYFLLIFFPLDTNHLSFLLYSLSSKSHFFLTLSFCLLEISCLLLLVLSWVLVFSLVFLFFAWALSPVIIHFLFFLRLDNEGDVGNGFRIGIEIFGSFTPLDSPLVSSFPSLAVSYLSLSHFFILLFSFYFLFTFYSYSVYTSYIFAKFLFIHMLILLFLFTN